MEEVELFRRAQIRVVLNARKAHSAGGFRSVRVLGGLRFTSRDRSRRHQKLTSLQSFALKSDQQGSAGSNVFHPSCGDAAIAYLRLR